VGDNLPPEALTRRSTILVHLSALKHKIAPKSNSNPLYFLENDAPSCLIPSDIQYNHRNYNFALFGAILCFSAERCTDKSSVVSERRKMM
jgi:hypothetical protein